MFERKSEEVSQTIIKLNLKKFEKNHPLAFYEFVQKCKNSNHKMFGKTQTIAMEFNLITESGEIDATVREIVLSNISNDVLNEGQMLNAMLLSWDSKNTSRQVNDSNEQKIDHSLIKVFIKIVNIQREEGIRGDMPGVGLFGSRASYNGNLMLYKYLDSESLKIIEEAKGYSSISRSSISIQADVLLVSLSGRYVYLGEDSPQIIAKIPMADVIALCQNSKISLEDTVSSSTTHMSSREKRAQSPQKPMIKSPGINNTPKQVSSYKKHESTHGESSLFHKNIAKSSPLKPVVIISPRKAEDELINLCFDGNDIERIKELLSTQGININRQFVLGNTCLIQASRKGYIEIVRLLLEKGADKDIANSIDQTPAGVASSPKIKELINSWNVTKGTSLQKSLNN